MGGKTGYLLYQNYPNPPQVPPPYSTPFRGRPGFASLLDIRARGHRSGIGHPGCRAPTQFPVGTAGLAKGVYYYQLQTEDYREVKKMVVQYQPVINQIFRNPPDQNRGGFSVFRAAPSLPPAYLCLMAEDLTIVKGTRTEQYGPDSRRSAASGR